MSYEGITVLNYRLGRKLGEGGFGVVYAAEHAQLGRSAAVKVLHRDYSKHSELADRFFREARLVCDIGHDAIVQVHNAGTLDSGEPFYLMELVEGAALDQTVTEDGPLSATEAVAVFGPIAEALTAAHARGVIHRDLKPSNIMLQRDGDRVRGVKLLDFGIAKLLDGVDDLSSSTGRLMGTPAYMAPEQARDAKNVDVRADVYSLAATVFGALTGRKLFEKTNVAELLLAVQSVPAPPLSTYLTGVPRRLERALARCLAKDRDERPATVEEAWSEIRSGLEAAGGLKTRRLADTVAPPGEVVALASTLTEAASSHAPTKLRKRGPTAWIIGLVVALVGAGSYVLATSLAEDTGAARSEGGDVVAAVVDAGVGGATSMVAPPDAAPTPPPPPDAAPPPPPDAAPTPRRRTKTGRRPRKPPRKPPPAPDPAPEPTPPKPTLTCSTASFAKVWRADSPSSDDVHAALGRLRRCKDAGELDATRFQQYQRALLRKL